MRSALPGRLVSTVGANDPGRSATGDPREWPWPVNYAMSSKPSSVLPSKAFTCPLLDAIFRLKFQHYVLRNTQTPMTTHHCLLHNRSTTRHRGIKTRNTIQRRRQRNLKVTYMVLTSK